MNRCCAAIAAVLAVLPMLVSSRAESESLSRARALFNLTDYERARQTLAADTSSLDESAFGEAMLMFARLEQDFTRAAVFYRRAMASENEGAARRARIELAEMQYAAGDYRGALELLSEKMAGGKEGSEGEALYFKALSRNQLGERARASAEFEQVTRGAYATWSVLARADIDAQSGRLADAVEKYRRLEGSKANPIATFKLGECYETLGDRDKALECYRSLVERFPRSFEASRGNEKIQLLTQKAKPKETNGEGGGESGEPRVGRAKPDLPVGRGFTIQFGSFSTRENALAVSKKLEPILRGVRVESVEMEGRIWNRVRAGFYETREAAESDVARAKDKTGLAGAIVPLK
jgi:tetratricopeptide (TPR) repeat protein